MYSLYKVKDVEYLVMIIGQIVIVSDKEFVHEMFPLENIMDEKISVPFTRESPEGHITFLYAELSVSELMDCARREITIEEFKEWAHYFGVNARISNNYSNFIRSVREAEQLIQVKFPDWER